MTHTQCGYCMRDADLRLSDAPLCCEHDDEHDRLAGDFEARLKDLS